jgi:hypothetical protein
MGVPKLILSARNEEQGYILITAIWLLILCGSIAALLMLRSLNSAKAAADNGAILQQKILLEGTVDTILAERLFEGNRSRWWLLPSSGSIIIDGKSVSVEISSENGRIDINEADPRLVDRALQGLGVEAAARAAAIGKLNYLRAIQARITSDADLDLLLSSRSESNPCLSRYFTLASGLPEPRAGQMAEPLARALAQPTTQSPMTPDGGTALRIVARSPKGAAIKVVARITGIRDQAAAITTWQYPARCI